jgi:hypothetical protein
MNGFSPVWILECAFSWSGRAKDFGQRVQLNGFSPVWILECSFRLSCRAKDFEQILQLNGFSPVWILECAFRWLICGKDFRQRVQLNGFSPVWTLAWRLSLDESLKNLLHNEHLKRLSEWPLKWILRMSDVGKDFVHWVQRWRFSHVVVTSSLKLICLSNNIFKNVSTREFICLCTCKKNFPLS